MTEPQTSEPKGTKFSEAIKGKKMTNSFIGPLYQDGWNHAIDYLLPIIQSFEKSLAEERKALAKELKDNHLDKLRHPFVDSRFCGICKVIVKLYSDASSEGMEG